MEEYTYELKIPKERVAVIVGTSGKVKQELEEHAHASIQVDSKEGDVKITGRDSVLLFQLKDVVKAIGRGFNPEIALQLLKQDYILEIINMSDFASTKKQLMRLKGRVIGTKGKARETMEQLTDTNISVYGKTIGIVGFCDHVAVCKRSIETLLSGSQHSTVFKQLERYRRQQKLEERVDI